MPVSSTDLDLSDLTNCVMMRIRADSHFRIEVELIGPPGSNVPGVDASDFPIVWYHFFDTSLRRFKATLTSGGLGEIDTVQSSMTAKPGESDEPSYDVKLKFAGGVLEFTCRDIHRRIASASEVQA